MVLWGFFISILGGGKIKMVKKICFWADGGKMNNEKWSIIGSLIFGNLLIIVYLSRKQTPQNRSVINPADL